MPLPMPGTDTTGFGETLFDPTAGSETEAGTVDGTADGTTGTGGCTEDCDDGIDCTEDACVDGTCVHTPDDTLCDDAIDCTQDGCDVALGCVHASDDTVCDDGIDCTVDACDVALGCVGTPDDVRCDDGIGCTADACDPVAGCTAVPDDAMCDDGVTCTTDACDPMLDCQSTPDALACDDGLACTTDTCDPVLDCQYDTTVLVYNGANGLSTAPEDAVTGMGFTPIVVTTEAGFNAAYDAGGFESIVVDIATGVEFSTIPAGMQTRLDAWVAGGGRLVFGFWNLDADAPMRTTLGVDTTTSISTPLPIHPAAGAAVDLFTSMQTFPAPITYPDYWADNGDQLSLAGPGFIAGRFSDASVGPGAILVTHADHVITNGFVILEIGQGAVDGDGDGINDGEELLQNEIDFVCGAL